MRIGILCGFLLVACTPTASRVLPCSTDQDCRNQVGLTSGVRCDLSLHLCVCDGPEISGCAKFIDAGTDSTSPDMTTRAEAGAIDISSPQCQTNANCPSSSPICRADGQCVQCADNSSCSGATPVCDTPTNRCVACLTSATCPAATPVCSAETCTTCTSNTQCAALNDPSRTLCSPAGACVGCLDSSTCPAAAPVCSAGTCTTCTSNTQCAAKDQARPLCSAAGACIQCSQNADCSATASVCDTTTNTCVGCLTSTTCGATAPICSGAKTCAICFADAQCAAKSTSATACRSDGSCVQCTGNQHCSGATPVCDTTTNKCVECITGTTCTGSTPICSAAETCSACTLDAQCAAKSTSTPACRSDGSCVQCTGNSQCGGATPVCDTTTNICVACLTSSQCSSPTTPICGTNKACAACTANAQCAAKSPTLPACALATGACVQCTSNTDCSGATPVCNTATNTCRSCTADTECAASGPGVCMSHQDGRCASDAETIVVTATSANLPSTSIPAGIRLLVIKGAANGTLAWSLPASPQMTIVGQTSGTTVGTLTGPASTAATIKVTGGDLYIRKLSVAGGSPGIWANGGNVLRLDHATVSNNAAGGILLDGAGFDIKNTTVNGNGANTGAVPFGGMGIQNTPTSTTVPKSISLTSITSNQLLGVTCGTGAAFLPTPSSVLATSNVGGDVGTSCGFTSCGTASATCGAQP